MEKVRVKRNSLLYRLYSWYLAVELKKPTTNYSKILTTVLFRVPIVWLLETGLRMGPFRLQTLAIIQIAGLVIMRPLLGTGPDWSLGAYLFVGIVSTNMIYQALTIDSPGQPLLQRVFVFAVFPIVGFILLVLIVICGAVDSKKFAEFTKPLVVTCKKAITGVKKAYRKVGNIISEIIYRETEIID